MISLDVENYCQNCPDFEPCCAKIYSDNICIDTLVRCALKEICANLKTYIEQQMARKEDK